MRKGGGTDLVHGWSNLCPAVVGTAAAWSRMVGHNGRELRAEAS